MPLTPHPTRPTGNRSQASRHASPTASPHTDQAFAQNDPILRFGAVRGIVPLGKTSIYKMIARGEFPRPIRLGPRSVGWRRSEVSEWLATRPRSGT